MGMYDCLIDRKHYDEPVQVKCFYVPIFAGEDYYSISNAYTWHSGGRLVSYNVGNELPLKTFYYDYPDDFVLVINETDFFLFALVENKRFKGFINSINDIPDRIKNFYSSNGKKIIASNKESIQSYINDRMDVNVSFGDFNKKWLTQLTIEQRIGELWECLECEKKNIELDIQSPVKNSLEEVVVLTNILDEWKQKYPKEFSGFLKRYNLVWGE